MDYERLQLWRNYFLKKRDYQSCVWVLSHEKMSKILVGDQDFRGDDSSGWWLTVIDSYRGREPIRLSYEFFQYGQGSIIMSPLIMLDSHVVNEVYKYIMSPDKMNVSRRKAVYKFLLFVVTHDFDYSPMFYYLEMTAKSRADRYEPYATERAKAIFALHTMDRQHFLETGTIVHDSSTVPWYLDDVGVSSIDELISAYAARMDKLVRFEEEFGFGPLADAIYATLLRIALTEHDVKGGVRDKYWIVREFMGRILGVVLGQELWVSIMYFTQPQRYSRFIPLLQRGMNFNNFCRGLRASAWDLILTRLPWLLLSTNMRKIELTSYPCCLTYICTAEHAIRDIMRSQKIDIVFDGPMEAGGRRPVIEYDIEPIRAILGETLVEEIWNDFIKWRMSTTLGENIKQPLSSEGVANVIAILEEAAAKICE